MNTTTTAYYADDSSLPLLATYIYMQFNFAAQYIILNNDDSSGSNQVVFSFDGTKTHGKLKPGESATLDNVDAAGIYLKYANGAPAYRLMARPTVLYQQT